MSYFTFFKPSKLPLFLLFSLALAFASDDLHLFGSNNGNVQTSSFLGSSNGLNNVVITGTDFGFYVNLIVSPSKDLKSMFLALYTSQSLLASNCQDFFKYDCEKYTCQDSGIVLTTEYPYFSAKGKYVWSNAYLDGNWALNTNVNYATECLGMAGKTMIGNGVYGMLGMGVMHATFLNFKDPIFSIYMNQNGTSGELGFSKDSRRCKSETPVATLSSNNDWHVSNIDKIEIGEKKIAVKYKMIFDINSESIGFPLTNYKDIFGAIVASVKGVELTCPTEEDKKDYYYLPTCKFTGKEAPVIQPVTIHVGKQQVKIAPETYLYHIKEGSIKFNIRALSNTLPDVENYVTPTYVDYIILGSPVMSYYYTVFDGDNHAENNNKIYLYTPNHDAYSKPGNIVIFLTVGLLIGIVVISLGYHFTKPQASKEEIAADPYGNNQPLLGGDVPTGDRPSSNGDDSA